MDEFLRWMGQLPLGAGILILLSLVTGILIFIHMFFYETRW